MTGLSLADTRYGAPGAVPGLVIAHGLFGSGRNWGVIARRLAEDRQVVAVDLRNHGDSPWSADHRYPDLAEDLAGTIGALGGPVDLLGHSMGGKAAMAMAVTQPALIRRLVVADIAPAAYGHTQQHLIDAMRATGTDFDSRAAADAALGVHVDDPGTRAFLLQSLDMKDHRWRLNLDALEAHMADILSFPRLDGAFAGPALFLSGGASDYVRPEHRPEILRLFPAARFASIPGTGHWMHAEKPRETEAAIRSFLA